MSKIVKMDGNVVREVIPDYALPVEKFYGQAFAAECMEAPDYVDQRWILNEDGSWTDPDTIEPEIPEEPPTESDVWDELDKAYQEGYSEGYTEGVNTAYDQ